jgi:hypothetical protein
MVPGGGSVTGGSGSARRRRTPEFQAEQACMRRRWLPPEPGLGESSEAAALAAAIAILIGLRYGSRSE